MKSISGKYSGQISQKLQLGRAWEGLKIFFRARRTGARMAEGIAGISELIEHGKKFTFGNFAAHSPRGYPSAYSDDWLVWTHEVDGILGKLAKSTIRDSIQRGLDTQLLGFGDDAFQAAKDSILNGQRAADRVFGEAIPASDRTVSLGHNSAEQKQALEKIDELVAAVEASNDFPGDPELKEQLIAELSAGRRLLEAAKVQVSAVRTALGPPLRWILEKAGAP
jgi:hypothetical protein